MLAHRVVAALTAVWLVLCGVLGARHEAEVRHCIDRDGNSVHASKMVGAHSGTDSDVHAIDGDVDADLCAIAAAMHQSASAACTRPRLPGRRELHVATTQVTVGAATLVRRVYRLAPKTSPPTRA